MDFSIKFVEFDNLLEMADWLDLTYPNEIYSVAEAEGFYIRDQQGDYVLNPYAIAKYLGNFIPNIKRVSTCDTHIEIEF
jgi:hypothetical protein